MVPHIDPTISPASSTRQHTNRKSKSPTEHKPRVHSHQSRAPSHSVQSPRRKRTNPQSSTNIPERLMQVLLFQSRDTALSRLAIEKEIQAHDCAANNSHLTEDFRPVGCSADDGSAHPRGCVVSRKTFCDGGEEKGGCERLCRLSERRAEEALQRLRAHFCDHGTEHVG